MTELLTVWSLVFLFFVVVLVVGTRWPRKRYLKRGVPWERWP